MKGPVMGVQCLCLQMLLQKMEIHQIWLSEKELQQERVQLLPFSQILMVALLSIKDYEEIAFDANGKYKPEFIIVLQIYGKKNEKTSSFGRDN